MKPLPEIRPPRPLGPLTRALLENRDALLRHISPKYSLSHKELPVFLFPPPKIACVFCGPWLVTGPLATLFSWAHGRGETVVWDGRFDAPVHAKADVKKVDNPRGLPTFFARCPLTKPPLSPRAPGERFVRRAPSNSLRSRSIAAVVTPRPQRNLRLCLAQRLRGQADITVGATRKISRSPSRLSLSGGRALLWKCGLGPSAFSCPPAVPPRPR